MAESTLQARDPRAATASEPRPRAPAVRPARRSRRKFVVAGAVLVLAFGYLMYVGLSDTMMFYLTPSELLARGPEVYAQQVRVGGMVVESSVHAEPKTLTLHFSVVDKGDEGHSAGQSTGPGSRGAIPVEYKGIVPDSFKPHAEVVLEGKLTAAGVFEATTLLAKCPSKYEAGS